MLLLLKVRTPFPSLLGYERSSSTGRPPSADGDDGCCLRRDNFTTLVLLETTASTLCILDVLRSLALGSHARLQIFAMRERATGIGDRGEY